MKYFVETESKVNKFRVHRLNLEIIVFRNGRKSLHEMRQEKTIWPHKKSYLRRVLRLKYNMYTIASKRFSELVPKSSSSVAQCNQAL